MPRFSALGRRAPGNRLPAELKVLLAAALISDIGGGLTFPFLLIYLHDVRHVSLALAGLLIGGVSVAGLPAGPAAGALVDRFGPRPVAIGCLCIQSVGTASLTLVRGPTSAILPVAILGVGQGAAWPAWFAILGVASRDQKSRPKLFALSFQMLNLGLGIGSVIGGLVVRVSDPLTFDAIYLADAATTLVVVAVLSLMRTLSARRPLAQSEGQIPALQPRESMGGTSEASAPEQASGGYRQMFADRRMRRLLLSLAVLALGGYGAVNTGYVGFAIGVVHVTPRTISLAFAANTAFIVVAQPLGLLVTGSMRRTSALSVVAIFFGASWAILALAGLWPRSTLGDALCIVTAVVFAGGEILLSPVQAPLANDLAPEESRGRYNAAIATIYSLTSVVCPMFAGALLGSSLGYGLLLLLVAFCGLSTVGFRWLRYSLTGAQNRAAASPALPG